MSDYLSFFCPGKPVPQGSKNIGRGGQLYEQNTRALKAWRNAIAFTCVDATNKHRQGPFEGPVELWINFVFLRPASHLTKAGDLRKSAPIFHTFKPDIDKLTRAVLDALTGAAFDDDRQVVQIDVHKGWTTDPEREGVHITCVQLTGEYAELVRENSPG